MIGDGAILAVARNPHVRGREERKIGAGLFTQTIPLPKELRFFAEAISTRGD
jgi:hypothetical protein